MFDEQSLMNAAQEILNLGGSMARAAAALAGREYVAPPAKASAVSSVAPRFTSPSDAATKSPSVVSPLVIDVRMLNGQQTLEPDIDGCSFDTFPSGTYAWDVPCDEDLLIRLADGTEIRFRHSEWASLAITPPKTDR